MDTKELEQVICKALQLLQNDKQFILLALCGDNRYSLEKFLVEADEIGRKNRLKLIVDPHASSLISEERLKKLHGVESMVCSECTEGYDEIFRDVSAVVFGSMDIGTASKIGSLVTDTLASRIASEAFMRGVRVVSDEFTDELEIKNERYRAAVAELLTKLSGFGMEFMPLNDIKRAFAQISTTQVEAPVKVITEDIVKNLNGSELRVAQDAVVTPLAKDVLREKKIALTRGN